MELPRYLQLLWDREPEGRRGPRPGRTIGEIGAAAVAIADERGLEAVSMKSVAEAVGFTTMSLYRYLDTKDELYAVMLDLAYGPPPPPDEEGTWRTRIAAWARAITERRLAHPWVVEAPQSAPPLTPNNIAWMEAGLEALHETPLSDQQRMSVMLVIDGWAHNHVRQTIQMGFTRELEPDSPQAAYLQYVGMLVDPVRYPLLAAAAPEAPTDDAGAFFEEEFDFGLAVVLDGVEVLIARESQREGHAREGIRRG